MAIAQRHLNPSVLEITSADDYRTLIRVAIEREVGQRIDQIVECRIDISAGAACLRALPRLH